MQKEIKTKAGWRTQRNTSGKTLQWSSPWDCGTSRNLFFEFFILIFLYFLCFCITQIGSTPSLTSIGWKVWPREIRKVVAPILIQNTNSNRGTLKPNLSNLNFPNPALGGVKWMYNFFLPNFRIFSWFQVCIEKLRLFYQTTSELGFRRCGIDSDWKLGETTKLKTSQWRQSEVVAMKERLKNKFCNLSRTCDAEN
jgi:hypothetical protein